MERDKTLTEQSSIVDVFERDNHSFSYWTKLYYNIHIVGSPENTVKAKTNDIKKFLVFLDQSIGTHNVNLWTPSVSKSFCSYLLEQKLQPSSYWMICIVALVLRELRASLSIRFADLSSFLEYSVMSSN